MINIQENISLAPMTSFRIGGDAKHFVQVKTIEELKESLDFAKEKKLDFYVIGSGTNLLVSDDGFSGLIIQIKMNEISAQENLLEVEVGVPLIKAINFSAENGLSGIEPLAGIPGTIGGAIRGNVGAFGTEINSVIKKVKALDAETQNVVEFSLDECGFSYRSSIFKKNKNLIVISATLELKKGEIETVKEKTKETILKRMSRGLHGVKSAGSFFINPIVTDEKLIAEFEKDSGTPARNSAVPAGWIIELADLKGKQIGGAQVSPAHANYIINAGDAKAADVIMLVSFIKQQVRDKFGIQLREEVNYLGF